MVNIEQLLSIVFYVVLIILGISLIVLTLRSLKVIDKFDRLLDDVSGKAKKLDGIFEVLDRGTDAFVSLSDSIVSFFTNSIRKILKRKKESEDE